MESTARTLRRIALAIPGLALLVMLVGCGGHGDTPTTTPQAPHPTTVGRSVPQAPPAGALTITSPAFADGAPIPVQYTCKGADTAPPLAWSAPSGGALVVDDPDAPHGPYVHWIVTGIPSGSGSTADGQTPAGASAVPNSGGQPAYMGPCPPAGTGTHHYRFSLYQLPATFQLAPGLAGVQAAQAIAQAATARTVLTGTFGA
ncbi:YbhB/YbcL family Raf kinase inhibitor-like protein [Mycobacterium sp. 663a-19]|uniref:YbhB/YbcL family Raf kinase inhibitor-like protein n=1 Tax=Mycobacterium sp. 663a-19 TaxID=2986148 RepID=UPI002D1EDE50|nr:YbhB/YbcL family Raf kinase inhibitor-like protein [Mycobacterium sp. 663a-19]MEB3981431.1 YbhB/YbcL family Raf kinase inhibitor-like protein [Mycobacterium sp. 663a-19]